MSLTRRLTLAYVLLLAAMGGLIASGLWGLHGMNRSLGDSLGQFSQLRQAYELGLQIAQARDSLDDAGQPFEQVQEKIRAVELRIDTATPPGRGHADAQAAMLSLRNRLTAARQALTGDGPRGAIARRATTELTSALGDVAAIAGMTRRRITTIEAQAIQSQRTATWVMVGVAIASGLLAALASVLHYRAVAHPLRRLALSVRRIASGRFSERIDTQQDREFAQIAREFNRMAEELQTLYQQLDDKVRDQSRALARSERLASVGFLAAGVAHEINNPLGVIAGESELALRRQQSSGGDDARTAEALRVISEEAFRCKDITEKLLGLSRHQEASIETLDIAQAVDEVVKLANMLPQSRGRTIRIEVETDPAPSLLADRLQLRQVLLNLLINALEATDAAQGQVLIAGRQARGRGRIVISDNGRGMDEPTLQRVFEPFFTSKRGGNTPGTGLGLSISHNIIRRLGGMLYAASDGPGRGSTFTLELPAGDAPTNATTSHADKPALTT